MQFETAMSKSTIIITVLYRWSVPTHPLAHPGDVYQRQLAREEVSRGGCAVPGASPSRRHLWLFRAWGVNGTKVVSVCWRHGSSVGRNCSWPTHPSWWNPAFSNKLAAGQRAIWGYIPCLGLSASAWLLQECWSVIGCAPVMAAVPCICWLTMCRLSRGQPFYNVPNEYQECFWEEGVNYCDMWTKSEDLSETDPLTLCLLYIL